MPVEDAQHRIALHQGLARTLKEREDDLVTELVRRQVAGRLTWDIANAAIAQIAELRHIDHMLEYSARKAIAEAEDELNG